MSDITFRDALSHVGIADPRDVSAARELPDDVASSAVIVAAFRVWMCSAGSSHARSDEAVDGVTSTSSGTDLRKFFSKQILIRLSWYLTN